MLKDGLYFICPRCYEPSLWMDEQISVINFIRKVCNPDGKVSQFVSDKVENFIVSKCTMCKSFLPLPADDYKIFIRDNEVLHTGKYWKQNYEELEKILNRRR